MPCSAMLSAVQPSLRLVEDQELRAVRGGGGHRDQPPRAAVEIEGMVLRQLLDAEQLLMELEQEYRCVEEDLRILLSRLQRDQTP